MFEERKLPSYLISEDIFPSLREFLLPYDKVLVVGCQRGIQSCTSGLDRAFKNSGTAWEDLLCGAECSWENIKEIRKKAEQGFDLIAALGGGKAIDSAKAAGELTDIPVITIPTIAATCAAVTPLSVIYSDDGTFRELFYLSRPPLKAFVDLSILAGAPFKYLRAGMGDTLAKYYEVSLAVRNRELNHSTSLGVSLIPRCRDSVFLHGSSALTSNKDKTVSDSFKEVVTANIITTGLVSCLIDDRYNGSVAHAVALGFSVVDGFDERVLHGDAVAYGILIQMLLEGNHKEYSDLISLYSALSLPTVLQEIISEEEFYSRRRDIYSKILTGPNLEGLKFMNEPSLSRHMSFKGGCRL